MNCVDVQAELFAYQFGEVAPEARSSVEAHLLTCPSCLRDFLALKREVETAASEPAPSKAARHKLRHSMAIELGLRPAPRRRSWWERSLALTFAAASLATALLLLHQVTTSPGAMPHGLADSPAGMRFSTGQH
jgi:anti-sigma factor RsiW